MDLTIRPREPADDGAIVAIHSRIDDDLPPLSVEAYRHRIDATPEDWHDERWVAVLDGRVIATGVLRQDRWRTEPGAYQLMLAVDPGVWNRGVGSRLYDHLLASAGTLDVQRLYSRARSDEGLQFAANRGFRRTGRVMQQSRLIVAEANLDGYEGVEERLAQEGIRISTLAELRDAPDIIHALYELDVSTTKDIPDSGLDVVVSFDEWATHVLHDPSVSPDTIWIALDGPRPVGTAFMERVGERAAHNGYTGVHRDYSGRGIARALKLRTIEWARENGIEHIYTGNLRHNRRMLDINVRLGYQLLRGRHELVKDM